MGDGKEAAVVVGVGAGIAGLIYLATRKAKAAPPEEPIPPAIELVALDWDAAHPFDTGSRHIWTVTMRNLSSARLTYQLQFYMNDIRFMGYRATLAPGEIREYSQPYTFSVEGIYTLTAEAFYNDSLLDEISSVVSVEAPPLPEIVDGEFVIAYISFLIGWEGGEPVYSDWQIITLTGNRWLAMTSGIMRFKVRNTGNLTATFQVKFAGTMSNAIDLAPGESDFVELSISTPTPGASGTFDAILYADGQEVDHYTIGWEVY